ncbi:hypothetical protein MMC29_002337 [Sticta canariensis]|nr:hypothetical protein [Sticta canariensis]
MDHDDKDNASGPLTAGERDPPKSSFLRARGRTKSPPWNRVVVLDCDRNTVEVKNKEDLDSREYHEVKLPSRLSQVTVFLNSKTVTTTTKEITTDGDSNVKLAKIYLNKLGFSNSVLRFLGQLSTLYVKIKPWSETSSFASSPHSVGGVAT